MKPIILITSCLFLICLNMMPLHGFTKKNSSVMFEPGPWKPLKSAASSSLPLIPSAILNRRGFLNPSASEQSAQSFQYTRQGTLLKSREGSSSMFGLDIPDSNLRLLLDIDEMSAKPNHENFKLKVIEREESLIPKRNHNNKYSVPLRPPNPLSSPLAPLAPSLSPSSSPSSSNQQKYQIGYIRAADLHSALHSGNLPPGSKAFPVPQAAQFSQPFIKSRPGENVADKLTPDNSMLLNPSNSLDSQPFVPMTHAKPMSLSLSSPSSSSSAPQALPLTSAPKATELEPSAQTYSKTNARPNKPSPPPTVSSPVKSLRKSRKLQNKSKGSSEQRSQRLADSTNSTSTTSTTTITTTTEATTTPEIPSSSRASSEKPSFKIADDLQFEEQQKQTEVPDEQIEDIQMQSSAQQKEPQQKESQQDQEREEVLEVKQNQHQQQNQEEEVQQVKTTKSPAVGSGAIKTPSPSQQQRNSVGRLRSMNSIESEDSSDSDSSRSNSSSDDESDNDDIDDGFELLRSQPLTSSSSTSSVCSPSLAAKLLANVDSLSLKEYAKKLGADALFNKLPGSEDVLQGMLDFANSGYTLFLPSNEAVDRLPKQLIKKLNDDKEEMRKMIENHVSEDKRQMSEKMSAMTMSSRTSSGKLRINRAASSAVVVNGNRVLSMNNRGPAGGSVHVIDGLLYPAADKNLMETMKSCNRFDGFVTLAEGTGLGESLTSAGPFTVFVPSNEALQKIPDVDLERIRNNMTALKEFLMFHVAQGSFYSADLRDGQFIPSLIPDQEIQVGVRVDGCNRRLVEANVSPLYRADIPASNGVIHVIDWILKPNDRDWCEGAVLPRRR